MSGLILHVQPQPLVTRSGGGQDMSDHGAGLIHSAFHPLLRSYADALDLILDGRLRAAERT